MISRSPSYGSPCLEDPGAGVPPPESPGTALANRPPARKAAERRRLVISPCVSHRAAACQSAPQPPTLVSPVTRCLCCHLHSAVNCTLLPYPLLFSLLTFLLMLPYPSAYHHRLPALHRPDVRGVCGCPSGTGGWCHWPRARANLAYWTGEAGGRSGGPRPVRRAAAHPRAGGRRRAPRQPDQPHQPRPLDPVAGQTGPTVGRPASHHPLGPQGRPGLDGRQRLPRPRRL